MLFLALATVSEGMGSDHNNMGHQHMGHDMGHDMRHMGHNMNQDMHHRMKRQGAWQGESDKEFISTISTDT